ncbi:MAG TPA: hypothetical protein EYP17_01460, partial [Candidatus Latescibacteria bacterium]|nr:hypothetical protein [Candidatus Latescibacterota bacterium]
MLTRRSFLRRGIAALVALITGGMSGAVLRMLRIRWISADAFGTPTASEAPLKEVMFYRKLEGNRIQCETCFRMCTVPP